MPRLVYKWILVPERKTDERTGEPAVAKAPKTPRLNDGSKLTPYERIRDAILEGTFPPGAQLVEVVIAEICGVSRTPAREALTRLEQDGLVERGPRGLIVRERSPEQILDIYETRVVLEAMAARMAADRYTELDKVRIMRFMEACERADNSDPAAMAAANSHFHQSIWEASHNGALIDVLNRLRMHLARYPETTLSHPGRWAEVLHEHRAIADAIVARDPERAAALTEQHFKRAREIRLESWASELH
jgi:DNA-binding GntR family transcriptional regulator